MRERKEDIAPLADFFVQKYSEANGIAKRQISDVALTMLLNHHWPGNVRELENTMHRAVLLARGAEIGGEAIMLTEGRPSAARAAANARDALPTAASLAGAASAPMEDGDGGGTMANATTISGNPSNIGQDLVGRTVADVERELIVHTLNHCLGNRTQAANILGISIRTLRNKLNQYADEALRSRRGRLW